MSTGQLPFTLVVNVYSSFTPSLWTSPPHAPSYPPLSSVSHLRGAAQTSLVEIAPHPPTLVVHAHSFPSSPPPSPSASPKLSLILATTNLLTIYVLFSCFPDHRLCQEENFGLFHFLV